VTWSATADSGVERAAAAVGLDVARFAAHSLRAGLMR
jgi:hypothetical protein